MNEISTGTLIGILIVLILISAYFSGSETGMMSLNRYRLRHLASKGNKGAKRVEALLNRPDRLIGLILIGNNLVNILASAIGTILGLRLFGDIGIAIATGVLTFLILIFAEVTPKTLAALYPEKVSYPSSYLLAFMMRIFYPLVWGLNLITNGIIRLLGIKTNHSGKEDLTQEELRTIVHEAGGLIPRKHQDMLLSILELEDIAVNDIMVPRNEITGININDDWKGILRQLTHAPHSRMVLYRDHFDEVVGILRVREAYRMMVENDFTKDNLLRAADEVYYIPEGTLLNIQLLKFQRKKERIGLIVNEYGDITGLITLEDILEEIIGEFTTSLSNAQPEEFLASPDGTFIVDGSVNIRDLNRFLKLHLPTDGPRTLNGLILEQLEDIPSAKLSLKIGDHYMEIVEAAENMIKQVKIYPDKPSI